MKNLRSHYFCKFLSLLFAMCLAIQPLGVTQAANHTNSSVEEVRILNLTANVDWDFDKTNLIQAATGEGTDNKAVKLTKDAIEKQVLREMARRIYLMTEGRHRVGTVYVYKNSQFGQNVDIQIVNNKIERSCANVAYWQVKGGYSSNYLATYGDKYDENGKTVIGPDGKPVQVAYPANLASLGTVIAHEMGHYIYGFMDEYVEANGTFDDKDDGWPRSKDNARSTIMNDNSAFTRLSVADDYPANGQKSQNQTAQARVYYTDANSLSGGSQWEMLTRDPADDSTEAKKQHQGNRQRFNAFKDYETPQNLSQLTKFFGVYCPPQETPKDVSDQCKDATYTNPGYQGTPKEYRIADKNSYDSKMYEKSGGTCKPDGVCVDATDGQTGSAFENFKVVFVGSANATTQRDVLMSDRLIQRDVLMIDRSMPQAPFKEAIQAAIQLISTTSDSSQYLGIVVSPSTGNAPLVKMQSVVANSSSLINALNSLERTDGAFDIAAAYNQASLMIASGRSDEDSATISLMTSFTNGVIPPDQGIKARNERTAFDIYYFPVTNYSQATGPLLKLAKDSGGESYTVKNAQEAAKAMMLQGDIDEGMRVSLLATDNFESGMANSRDSVAFNVSRYDETVVAEWYFDPVDKNSVNFRLQPPLGTAIMTLHEDSDLDAGYAKIEVINPDGSLSGGWIAEVFYTANLSDTVEVAISTVSEVEITASMTGGEKSDPRLPVLRVRFSGNSPITQAKVAADFFRAESGREVLSGVVLKDDGQGVDAIANDGSYAVDLSGMLPASDFEVVLQAETTEDSMFEPNQRFARGSTVSATPVGAGLKRVDSLSISLEAGAPGVLTSSGGGSGGGCTVANDQNDSGLVILLMVALLGLTLGRRRYI